MSPFVAAVWMMHLISARGQQVSREEFCALIASQQSLTLKEDSDFFEHGYLESAEIDISDNDDPHWCNRKISFVRAKDLQPKDLTGASDPYVTVYGGKRKKKSSVKSVNLNPVWNEVRTIIWDGKTDLCFVVSDYERIGGSDRMGGLVMPARIVSKGFSGTVPLFDGREDYRPTVYKPTLTIKVEHVGADGC